MFDLPVQEEINDISTSILPTQDRQSPKYFTPPASPMTSVVHQISEHTKQPERLSLFRRFILSFCRSLRHENQHDKDITKTNLDSIEKYFINKNDDSIKTEPASFLQMNLDETYCHELLNLISTLWFGSNVEQRQAFDLLEQNRLKYTMVPEFLARLAHSLSKHAIDFHDESILRIFTYSNKRKF